ncbi:MAG: hypothetical protein SGARI_004420, partial [Bacillariaceae sp.]
MPIRRKRLIDDVGSMFTLLVVTLAIFGFSTVSTVSNDIFAAVDISSVDPTTQERNVPQNFTALALSRVAAPRIAYATLSYGYQICPALTATHQFQKVISQQSKYANSTDIIIMRLGAPILPQFLPNGVQQLPVQETPVKGRASNWIHTFSKFWVTKLDYDAVVFLDADVFLYKPLDAL